MVLEMSECGCCRESATAVLFFPYFHYYYRRSESDFLQRAGVQGRIFEVDAALQRRRSRQPLKPQLGPLSAGAYGPANDSVRAPGCDTQH